MKTIGIIGGLTWLSTVEYYKLLNRLVNGQLGGSASAKVLMYSVNFEEIKTLTIANDWSSIANAMSEVAVKLENAGADCLLLGANTMHKIADKIQDNIKIPLIHIATATALAINKSKLKKMALLGTKYTMQLPFYTEKLKDKGIETIIPAAADIEYINNAIYEEMSKDLFLPATRERFKDIIAGLIADGAEGVILGCTELPILLKDEKFSVELFDTTSIHCKAAVDYALA